MPKHLVQKIQSELQSQANPKDAKPMQAYMKTEQPFYGIKAGPRRRLVRSLCKENPVVNFNDYKKAVWQLWEGSFREDQYAALDMACYFKKFHTDEAMPFFEKLVKAAPHWDTLDYVVGKLISPLYLKNRKHEARILKWSDHKSFWVRRASLLAHLHHKKETDLKVLEKTIVKLMKEDEFFIRKAIGWILRDVAYAHPDWVKRFVKKYENVLSGLSKREALKHLK